MKEQTTKSIGADAKKFNERKAADSSISHSKLTEIPDYQWLNTFLQGTGTWPPSELPLSFLQKLSWYRRQDFPAQAQCVGEYILAQLQPYHWLARIDIIGEIDSILMQAKLHDPEQVTIFKQALCKSQSTNWKHAFLELSLKPLQQSYFMVDQANYDIAHPIKFDELRFKRINSKVPQIDSCSILGSTFATNKSARLNTQNVNHILDAVYAAYCINGTGSQDFMLALGDGCGGHFGEAQQDKMIARAAYFACKHAVRILAACPHPESLTSHLPDIVSAIGKEVTRKTTDWQRGFPWQEGTALVAARAFKCAHGYRLLGFNLGDTMLISWNPVTQIFKTIAPAHQALYPSGQRATAILPTAYKAHEIYPIDETLPEHTLLIPLSDGMYEYLPCTKENKSYPDGAMFEQICLNEQAIVSLLKTVDTEAPVSTYLEAIVNANVTECEQQRQQQLAQQAQDESEAKQTLAHSMEDAKHQDSQPDQHLHDREVTLRQIMAPDYQIQMGDDACLMGVRLKSEESLEEDMSHSASDTCSLM